MVPNNVTFPAGSFGTSFIPCGTEVRHSGASVSNRDIH